MIHCQNHASEQAASRSEFCTNPFAALKKNALSRKDKSNKGSVDEPIRKLIDKINALGNYYTTSSCSGRVVLWVEPESGKKNKVSFLYRSHEEISITEIKKSLQHLPLDKVWFRFEPMILHVACKTLDDANIILEKAKPFFKHSGIITAKEKIVVEIRGSEFIEAIVAKDGKMVASEIYLSLLVNEGNRKMNENQRKINAYTSTIS
ncbi:hypothetical protein HY497_02090 [Candidatus Woesearchaeota archaeon]|nr:hypothetical protein [Candidatus Woesearchaeota archaeon]